jgi:hypothetical protein
VVSQGFGDPTNGEVMRLGVFNGQLYAATWSYTSTHGAEIWRSSTGDSGSWTQVVSNGLGDAANRAVLTMEEFNGALYAGTRSYIGGTYTGAEVWRTADGLTWTAVITNGFGYTGTYDVSALEVFGGYLYAGTGRYDLSAQSYPGGQIWRCSQASGCDEPGDWEVVIADGFGHPDNIDITSLLVFGSHLYALAYNFQTGMEVWRTADGITWEQAGFAGFGDSNNYGPYWDNSATVFNNRLFIGTYNPANGGEVWEMQSMPQALVTIADPGQSYTLEFDYANGGKSTVGIPANLLPAGSTLVYAPFNLGWRPPNHRLAGRAFQLSVYQGGVLQENLSLSSPLQVTIDYTDGEVWGLDEDLLVLLRWEPSTQSWVDAACGQYDRQPAQNRISVPVCHLSLFGLFGEQEYIYLPVIRR